MACEVLLQKRMLSKAAAVAAARPAEAAAAAASAAAAFGEGSSGVNSSHANSLPSQQSASLAAAAAAAALGCVGAAAAKLHVSSKVQTPRKAFIPESVLRERELKRVSSTTRDKTGGGLWCLDNDRANDPFFFSGGKGIAETAFAERRRRRRGWPWSLQRRLAR